MFGIKNDINRALNRLGIINQVEAFALCGRAKKEIISQLGKGKIKIRSIKYLKITRTIEVGLESFSFGQKIRSQEEEIIKRINQSTGKGCVEKIRYRLY